MSIARCMGLILMLPALAQADWQDWWLTPDQQAQRLYDNGNYAEAARLFTTPDRIGAALYQAGEFDSAAAVFGRVDSPEGALNRGNALVMLGQYEAAIKSYDLALERRPGWVAAQDNRDIARVRLAALAPTEDDAGGTGGQLAADEIVFDDSGRVDRAGQEVTVDADDQATSQDALRALWLRRVDTRPADFLAAKFNTQLALREDQP